MSRLWTIEDVNYLEENWGKISIKSLSKNLNRSHVSVKTKAKRIGLPGINISAETIIASELARAIGCSKDTVYHWIKDKGLNGNKRKLSNVAYWRISLPDFWEWAFCNSDLINWRKFEINSLGLEPDWVSEIRKNNKRPINSREIWSESQDKFLMMYWNSNKSIDDISKIMNRTKDAIKHRIRDLGLPKRRIPIKWKKIEDDLLIRMNFIGYSDELIAEELGRSRSSVRYRRNKLIKLGILKRDTKTPTKVDLVSIETGLDNKPVTL